MQFVTEYQPRNEERVELFERVLAFQSGHGPRFLYSSLAAAFPAGFVFVVASDMKPIGVRVLIGMAIMAALTIYWVSAWRKSVQGMSQSHAARSREMSSRTLNTLTLDEEGVESSTVSIRLRIPWSELDHMTDMGWGFFFLSEHVGGITVPRRVFDSDESYRAAIDGAVLLAREAGSGGAVESSHDCKTCGHWRDMRGRKCQECHRAD